MADAILCSIQGCNNNSNARGYCRSHYERWRKHGDPMAGRFNKEGCEIDGCGGKHASRGLCLKHYARLLRHGDPLIKFKTTHPGEAIEWLKCRVNHSDADACLLWPFSVRNGGYGHMRFGGRYIGAHQMMCRMAHGNSIGLQNHVAHSCGNPVCVNPHHLRWATKSENEADKVGHGTHNRGARHGMAKLTELEVREIRLLRGRMTQKDISDKFGVSQATINHIQVGKSWTSLK